MAYGRGRKGRLNDTAAIVDRPLEGGESHHISTRKIDNGYLVCQSTCNPQTGEYRSSEEFVKNPPRISNGRLDGRQSGREARDSAGSGGLADTKRYLGEDV